MRVSTWTAGVLLAAALHGGVAQAGDAPKRKDQNEAPSMELLEFLADWETSKGQWLDPVALEKMQLPDQEQKDHEQKK